MRQITFACQPSFEKYVRSSRREQFLNPMEAVVPWAELEAIHTAAPKAQNMTNRRVKTKQGVDEEQKRKNRTKSRVRAKVEWCFRILKRVFGYTKVRYRGIKKNPHWHLTAFALINLYQQRKRLVPLGA